MPTFAKQGFVVRRMSDHIDDYWLRLSFEAFICAHIPNRQLLSKTILQIKINVSLCVFKKKRPLK